MRPLITQRRVLAVARIDPGLVGEHVEELGDDAVVEGGEALGVLVGIADAAGEQ
jgi:hypothetical protein